MTGTVASALTTGTADLIDVIIVIAGLILAMMKEIDVIITTTIAAMTGTTTTVAMTVMTGATTI
jgi:hypothetical protein